MTQKLNINSVGEGPSKRMNLHSHQCIPTGGGSRKMDASPQMRVRSLRYGHCTSASHAATSTATVASSITPTVTCRNTSKATMRHGQFTICSQFTADAHNAQRYFLHDASKRAMACLNGGSSGPRHVGRGLQVGGLLRQCTPRQLHQRQHRDALRRRFRQARYLLQISCGSLVKA